MRPNPPLLALAVVALLLAGIAPSPALASAGGGDGVTVLFDFGNGRLERAQVPLPEPPNAWCATIVAATELGVELDYTFSQYGVFLHTVDGRDTPMDFSAYWGLWQWNAATSEWAASPVGALDLPVANGTSAAWRFGAFMEPGPDASPVTWEPWLAFRGGRDVSGTAGPSWPSVGGHFWAADVGNGAIDTTLVVADGRVYGVTGGIYDWSAFAFVELPSVFALDADTGAVAWSQEFGGSIGFEIATPVYRGGTLYVAVSGGAVMALNARTGDLVWQTDLDGGISASPTVAKGRVLVGTGGGELVALRASDGALNWSADLGGGVYLAAPTVREGVVYIGTENGSLHALSLENGTEHWNLTLDGRLRGTPLVTGDRIYIIRGIYSGFSATDGFLHALTLGGEELWNVTLGPTGSSPAIAGDLVVVGSQGGLWAIRGDGSTAWRYTEVGAISASPSVAGDAILVMSNENDTDAGLHTSVIALWKDGTVLWTRELVPHNWALASVSLADGRAYAATDAGWVYCLGETPMEADFDLEVDGLRVTLRANSSAPGVTVVRHVWSIEGPDVDLEGEELDYEFKKPGTYAVSLTITDEFGRERKVTRTVEVERPPEEPDEGLDMVTISVLLVVGLVIVAAVTILLTGRGGGRPGRSS